MFKKISYLVSKYFSIATVTKIVNLRYFVFLTNKLILKAGEQKYLQISTTQLSNSFSTKTNLNLIEILLNY